MGDGWSIAWRVHDAQFWGVSQRRRRICLVADFSGDTAPWILFDFLRGGASAVRSFPAVGDPAGGSGSEVFFVGESLSRDFETSGEAGKETASDPESGSGETGVLCVNPQDSSGISVTEDMTGTLVAQDHGHHPAVYDARGNGDGSVVPTITGDHGNRVTDYTAVCVEQSTYQDVCGTLSPGAHPGSYNGQEAILFEPRSQDGVPRIHGEISPTLNTAQGGQRQPCICIGNGQTNNAAMTEVCNTLDTMHDQQAVMAGSVVRRLTPLECERLQGFPDGWTDIGDWIDSKGKRHKTSDSVRYKALGNSIALPYWAQMLRRMIRFCKSGTMASLFDGIGGFPLCWYWAGGTTLWASEIEEFPIAVTKLRFGE